MVLRALQESDLPQLATIEERTQAFPWTLDIFIRCWELHYPSWVIIFNEKIVGFLVMSLQATDCHILSIAVDPDYQGQGLGYQLMQQAISSAKALGGTMMILEVRKTNLPAIKLYEKCQFNQIGTRKNYYQKPGSSEDALVFARDLF